MKDDVDQYIPNTNVVTSVNLINPNAGDAELLQLSFQPDYEAFLGEYDCNQSNISYNFHAFINDNSAKINEPLVSGIYTLEVTADDGVTYTKDYNFNEAVDLPVISAKSFDIRPDSSNNIFWTWEIPDSLFTGFSNLSISSRAYIMIYNNEQFVAYFHVKVPAHMGHLFIAGDTVQQLMTKGNKFKFGVDVRENNNNNRSYGSTLEVTNLLTNVQERKKVVVIPLF
jgi:hypothetical protein